MPPPAPHAHERARGARRARHRAAASARYHRRGRRRRRRLPQLERHELARASAENGAAAASGGDAGGGWHVVTALVRRLVTESADGGVRPERRGDLSAALDAISQSITSQDEGGGGDAGDGGGGDGVLDDEHGRPVAPGVLCFDEVQMMDVADAVIVTGVFQRLFEAGWVLVCTCNRTVDEFAASALHREHPHARFTRDVAKFCAPLDLGSLADGRKPQDYRQSLPPDETTLFDGDTGGAPRSMRASRSSRRTARSPRRRCPPPLVAR